MDNKVGRNDPCPCGSGKKFKQCCWKKNQPGQIKFKAQWINPKQPEKQIDLLERTFGRSIAAATEMEEPPAPSSSYSSTEEKEVEENVSKEAENEEEKS